MIRLATREDIPKIVQLITLVVEQDIKDEMTAQGVKTFFRFIEPEAFKKRIRIGSQVWIYKINAELAGIIEISPDNHILLFFVSKDYRNQGIGKALFNKVKSDIPEKITANSTAYALPIYLKLGFVRHGLPFKRNGITAYPVVCKRTQH